MRLFHSPHAVGSWILRVTVMLIWVSGSNARPMLWSQTKERQTISDEQAIALALNSLEKTASGWQLKHPRHTVEFSSARVRFTPHNSVLDWDWQLTFVGANDQSLSSVKLTAIEPHNDQPGRVAYERGAVIEQYLFHANAIEQQFILPRALPLGHADLVIAGRVTSAGEFETDKTGGGVWRTDGGAVHLGQVYVYDAAGRELPAHMSVTATATRIQVDGQALAHATYPVTIDPEIGADDFRLSDMGTDGDASRDAYDAAVAYSSTNNEYFVVWSGDEGNDDEFEIRGQRIDAATGAQLGTNDIVLSSMGPSGNISYTANTPAVAYNSVDNEYLVVWSGDDNTAPLVEGELEIFGQRVDAATGNGVGNNDFRISDMGPNGNNAYDASSPAVAYSANKNEYVVVWQGDDDTGALVGQEFEIYAQRIYGDKALGDEIGSDARLSDMGPDGEAIYDAVNPAIAHNSVSGQYLVVWWGDDNTLSLVEGELEIFGQLLNSSGLELLGDFRISAMGPNGNTAYEGRYPAIASSTADKEFLVVWKGTAGFDTLDTPYYQVFGQRIDAVTGVKIGSSFQISNMWGSIVNPGDVDTAAVSYNSASNDYWVVWQGINHPPVLEHGNEIYAQRLSATGAEIGADTQVSRMGGYGTTYEASNPAVAYNATDNEYLAVWHADDDTGALADEEYEIYGQRYTVIEPLYLPLVMRNYPPCETEPNDVSAQANGPLVSGQSYCGYYNSGAVDGDRDFFTLTLTATGTITVDLTNVVAGQQVQLSLYYQTTSNQVGFVAGPPFGTAYQINYPSAAAGQYFIRVFIPVGYSPTTPYTLLATYP